MIKVSREVLSAAMTGLAVRRQKVVEDLSEINGLISEVKKILQIDGDHVSNGVHRVSNIAEGKTGGGRAHHRAGLGTSAAATDSTSAIDGSNRGRRRGTWTNKQREEAAARMKAYWNKKRKEAAKTAAAKAETKAAKKAAKKTATTTAAAPVKQKRTRAPRTAKVAGTTNVVMTGKKAA